MNEKYKNLFDDLGKPTLRGVRKCPKCGAFNGTRGISCKNKSCNLMFKESKKKKKKKQLNGLDAVKLITDPDSQIYSVKIHERGRPRSLEYRGFILFPLIDGLDGIVDNSSPEIKSILQLASQCFIQSCPSSKQELTEATLNANACKHIDAAISSIRTSVPLAINSSALDCMSIDIEQKKEILEWLAETSPLVQRVSENVMVVKCKLSDGKYPVRYLHVYFFNMNPPIGGLAVCECEMNESFKPGSSKKNQTCIHYCACICAFLSDEKLKVEFQSFISYDKSLSDCGDTSSVLNAYTSLQNAEEEEDDDEDREIFIIPTEIVDGCSSDATIIEDDTSKKRLRKDDTSTVFGKNRVPAKRNVQSMRRSSSTLIDEDTASVSFLSWLSSVTERINQAMHFQFSGKPDPLVFHVPQIFFDCLQQRISASSMKKRLPNSTTTFVRKDALPLGIFTKYTWHINSILHVKQIFDNPEVPLQVTRSFVENRDGTYDYYEPYKDGGKELTERFKKTLNKPLIKPLELQTFLKVGNVCSNTKSSSPFIVEWIPNILPQSAIGELRISFEYGHLRNGQIETAPSQSLRKNISGV